MRSALIATTRALLAEAGPEGLSLREISRRTGVSHAAAYNHFRDKGALLGAIVDAAFERIAAELRAARATTDDPTSAFQAVGVAYVRFAYQNAAEFRIMFRPELCGRLSPPTPDDAAYGVLVACIEAAQAAGVMVREPIPQLAFAAWSMVHGVASLILDGPDTTLAPDLATAELLARSCVATLAEGFRVR